MNDAQLNGDQIGSSSTVSGIFFRGAITVLANGLGSFVRHQRFYVTSTAKATAVGKFGAIFSWYCSTLPTALSTSYSIRWSNLVGFCSANATVIGKASAGIASMLYGRISAIASSNWTARVKVAIKAITGPTATVVGKSGLHIYGYGDLDAAVTNLEAHFTTFGASAPDERYIIVQQEDRKVTVV
jgi:hypothetical protein